MADTEVPFKNENLYVEHELNGEKKVSQIIMEGRKRG